MQKFFLLVICLFATLFPSSLKAGIDWTVADNAKVYSKDPLTEQNYLFDVTRGTKAHVLARRGAGSYQVQFSDGQIGWMDYRSFLETRKLFLTRNINRFPKPEQYDSNLKGYTPNDTLYYLGSNTKGNYIQVTSQQKLGGWIINLTAYPLAYKFVPLRETTPILYAENLFKSRLMGKTFSAISEKYGNPESVLRKGSLLKATFSHITLVAEGKHFHGVVLNFQNDQLESIEFSDAGESMWIERLPLASLVRTVPLATLFVRPVTNKVVDVTGQEEKGWILPTLFLLLKFALVILFFSIPVVLARLSLFPLLRVKILPNRLLKILNYLVFFFVFYLFYLLLILNVGYVSPVFFTILTFGVLYFAYRKIRISEFNHKRIDKDRCPSCRELHTIKFLNSEFISKKHDSESHSWRTYEGRTTAHGYAQGVHVTVHTDHYQSHSTTNLITLFTYHDHHECTQCHSKFWLLRIEKKYGHL
ncbi:MAG: hypothetical protein LWW85_09605 [Marinilabiliales bacterium]|nr:hypothetical protein [Marinilabiliales bacterium]